MKRKYIFIEFMNYSDTDKNKTWAMLKLNIMEKYVEEQYIFIMNCAQSGENITACNCLK